MNKKQKNTGYQSSIVYPGGRTGVLLIHSLGGTPIELKFVAQALAREGYTVHCPILPGMTVGTDVLGLSSWQDWYAAVERAHDEISKSCDQVLVGGLSAGAILALRLAALRSRDVAGVMLFAPTLWPNGWAIPWYFNFFRIVLQKSVARMFYFKQRYPYGIKDDRVRNFMIEAYQGEVRTADDLFGKRGGMILQFRRMTGVVKGLLGSIRQPTLIFHPRQDDQSSLSNALKIQRMLAGPCETIILDDCYHMVTLDRQRQVVVDRTLEYVSRLVGDTEGAAAATSQKAKPRSGARGAALSGVAAE